MSPRAISPGARRLRRDGETAVAREGAFGNSEHDPMSNRAHAGSDNQV